MTGTRAFSCESYSIRLREPARRRVVGRGITRGIAAKADDRHALAVDCELDLVWVFEAARLVHVGPHQGCAKIVFGVQWKRIAYDRAAEGSERLSLHVLILRIVLAERERVGPRCDLGVTNGKRTQPFGGADVALEQHGRKPEHVGDVVEAEARIVRRKQGGHIAEIEREQIADRVGVLGAVHPVRRETARIRMRAGGSIECRLERSGKTVITRRVRSPHTGRRHRTGPKLSDDFFPNVAVLGNGR